MVEVIGAVDGDDGTHNILARMILWLTEELFELAAAILEEDEDGVADALWDMLGCLFLGVGCLTSTELQSSFDNFITSQEARGRIPRFHQDLMRATMVSLREYDACNLPPTWIRRDIAAEIMNNKFEGQQLDAFQDHLGDLVHRHEGDD